MIAAAIDGMNELPWYRNLSADARGWVRQVVSGGTAHFVRFLEQPDEPLGIENSGFDNAPVAAAHAISLQQTVELIRVAVGTVGPVAMSMVAPNDEEWLRERISQYGREVGFAAALVYAQAAEQQGARTARASTDLIEGLLHDAPPAIVNQLGLRLGLNPLTEHIAAASRPVDVAATMADVERAGRRLERSVIVATYDRAVVALWPVVERDVHEKVATEIFGSPRGIVLGSPANSLVTTAGPLHDVLAGLRARQARPAEQGILTADELLPERALIGELRAQDRLREICYDRLEASGSGLIDTIDAMLGHQCVLEQAAKAIPVHVNTLRYRLERVRDITGYDVREPRGALALQIGFVLARVSESPKL